MKTAIVILGTALLLDPCVRSAMAQPADTEENGKADTLSNKDKSFLRKAEMGGLFEVKLGEAVLQKATREDVRKFAQHMVDDHTKGNKQLLELAKRKGLVDLPTTLDEEHQKRLDDIVKLQGVELDRKYVSTMVKDHEEDVDEFTRVSDKADDAEVRDFASKTLPMLKEHLKTIQAIAEKMQKK